jgi:hypothetical protein
MTHTTKDNTLERFSLDSRSILARLMACENIIVEHMADAQTAYFDTISRRLVLPMWDNMDADVYDMLVGHEVSHALYTPASGWVDAIMSIDPDNRDAVRGYLNIVEDARIERLIKRRYPGLIHNFRRGYVTLYNNNIFGTKGVDLTTLPLIDRLNLRAKVGLHLHHDVPLATHEEVWYTEMMATESWDDVVELTRRLYLHAHKPTTGTASTPVNVAPSDGGDDDMLNDGTDSEPIEQDASGDPVPSGSGTAVANNKPNKPNDPSTKPDAPATDAVMHDRIKQLRNNKAKSLGYINLPVNMNWRQFVVDYRDVQADFASVVLDTQAYDDWRANNIAQVNLLVKEFEIRKAADSHARTSISRSGVLDADRLHQYRFNDDLFRRMATVREGKSHGMVMFLDWSSSMSHVLDSTVRQVMTLVAFCRRVNIPYEVYAFSNHGVKNGDLSKVGDDDAIVHDVQLFNFASSRMNNREHLRSMNILASLGKNSAYVHSRYHLGGTPLHLTMLLARYVVADFRNRTKVQIANTIFLTDGEDSQSITSNRTRYSSDSVLRDMQTRTQVVVNRYKSPAVALLRLLASTTDCRVIGMYLTNSGGGKTRIANLADVKSGSPQHEALVAAFRKNRFVEIKNQGYDSYFVIPSDKLESSMDEREAFMQKEHKTKNGVARSFATQSAARVTARVLIGRFIDLISR